MELDVKKSHGKEEVIRRWEDKEMKEIHKSKGYNWRSNRTRLRVIPVTEDFRDNFDDIFRKNGDEAKDDMAQRQCKCSTDSTDRPRRVRRKRSANTPRCHKKELLLELKKKDAG